MCLKVSRGDCWKDRSLLHDDQLTRYGHILLRISNLSTSVRDPLRLVRESSGHHLWGLEGFRAIQRYIGPPSRHRRTITRLPFAAETDLLTSRLEINVLALTHVGLHMLSLVYTRLRRLGLSAPEVCHVRPALHTTTPDVPT